MIPLYVLLILASIVMPACIETFILDIGDTESIGNLDSDTDDTDNRDSALESDTGTITKPDSDSDDDKDSSTRPGVVDSDVDTDMDTDGEDDTVLDTDSDEDSGDDTGTDSGADTNGGSDSDTDTALDTDTNGDSGSSDTGTGGGTDTNGDSDSDTHTNADTDTVNPADCLRFESEGQYLTVPADGCVVVDTLPWGTMMWFDSVDGWTPPVSFTWSNSCGNSISTGGVLTFPNIWFVHCLLLADRNCPTVIKFHGEANKTVRVRYYSADSTTCTQS